MSSGLIEKERIAIERLKAFAPADGSPYWVGYSGGKDSDCIRILCDLANVNHTLEHNHTTVDAPETVYYVRSIPNIHINYPEKTMWQLIVEHGMPPTRLVRYCCEELKEGGGQGCVKVLGVRADESSARKRNAGLVRIIGKPKTTAKKADELGADYEQPKNSGIVLNMDNAPTRRLVEHCFRTTNTMLNPILDWTDEDVWDFLHAHGCKSNPLYECGYKRIGCIGCPMANSHRLEQFNRYPKYKENYIRAFDHMLKKRIADGKPTEWKTAQDVFDWWVEGDYQSQDIFAEQDEYKRIDWFDYIKERDNEQPMEKNVPLT